MVSQRQRLARKQFKQANPDKFPKPEPQPTRDPSKKKKQKSKFKKKKDDGSKPRTSSNNRTNRSSFTKHPLRVPGMKPGESCFICKGQDHIARNCPEKAEWDRHKTCLHCRQRGHSMKNCPNKDDESMDKKLCYNCGETGHSLFHCPQPRQDGGTKFASCFICHERGHLSKDCPKNTHGIYPKGGSCKVCGGVTHLAKDCPEQGNRGYSSSGLVRNISIEPGENRRQVTKFVSGDDLDDDFVAAPASTKEPAEVGDESKKKECVKVKKKQGPKVVNFVG